MTEIPKVYDPQKVEPRWYPMWLEKGYFHASLDTQRPRYCVVIPPPNITGSLHLGHALNNTLQDILVRWKRMEGYNVLWVPGTDHAGIATQNVVERQLKTEGKNREELGREKFIERVWHWRQQSGRTIIEQLKGLGASCDWSRERFTMDDGLSAAVQEVFVGLYNEGLIYRAQRLINMCFCCQTALSDVEVEHEEVQGKMYYIKYPLDSDPEKFLMVATTRPETMLGDTAVAVHPEDTRYKQFLHGNKKVRLPLTERTIPILADPILVDREFGTGAVKITPGHDFNDEKAGKRHNLPTISLLDPHGRMDPYALSKDAAVKSKLAKELGYKSILEARKLVLEWLEKEGFLIKTEDHHHAIGKCYRCKSVVNPYYSPQWFFKVNDPKNSLAQPAIEAVRSGRIRLVPKEWENNYYGWMENIQDWCISRQIWWGHPIPAWYCKQCDKNVFKVTDTTMVIGVNAKPIVQTEIPEKCPRCESTDLIQDPDVLDTWFSSALWPFSTLGWPKTTPELKLFYPTDTLVTSFDILFFWVARMIMMGLKFMKEIPFKDVYIHALVRDAEGQKMSKSKGNVIDPLGIMDKYGTDALRFTLAAMASPGRDIKLSEQRIEGYRNFANKIWNAARFVLMNLNGKPLDEKIGDLSLADCWIRVRLRGCIDSVTKNLESYRFDEAANQLYQFIWHEYCDWYLELIKPRLSTQSPEAAATRATMVNTLETLLRLLHPFMPFITEDIWQKIPHHGETIVLAPYPKAESISPEDQACEGIMEEIISIIKVIRTIRSELNVPSTQRLKAGLKTTTEDYAQTILRSGGEDIRRMAGLSEFTAGPSIINPSDSMVTSTTSGEVYVVIEGVDLRKELSRVEKKLATAKAEFELADQKWRDQEFQRKAPAEVKIDIELRRGKLSEDVYTLSERHRQIKKLLGE